LSFLRAHLLLSSFLQQEEGYNFLGEDALRESAVTGVLESLRRAVTIRCQCIDAIHERDSPGDEEDAGDSPARIMILFSGGVDSSLIAALASEALPPDLPIDLVSICFANGASPDRASALDSLEELTNAYPTRKWRFIAVNKSYEDVEACRPRLLRLLIPSETVMDLNIGAALWLAADGEGYVYTPNCPEKQSEIPMAYRSQARVVFLGHGADELFGGYGRHRTRFRSGGWEALSEELAMDMRRLWVRNLGRDDRLVADRGREARHPFLDEQVLHEALKWPLESLVDLGMESGVGDKLVLRACLRRLGLPRAAARVKRAIQFGTRLAKAANAVHFGGTKRANARNAGSVRLDDVSVV
jgi:asparagine synthetase B (glutamine-hydrolysing)